MDTLGRSPQDAMFRGRLQQRARYSRFVFLHVHACTPACGQCSETPVLVSSERVLKAIIHPHPVQKAILRSTGPLRAALTQQVSRLQDNKTARCRLKACFNFPSHHPRYHRPSSPGCSRKQAWVPRKRTPDMRAPSQQCASPTPSTTHCALSSPLQVATSRFGRARASSTR
jgi:hypothetical protein